VQPKKYAWKNKVNWNFWLTKFSLERMHGFSNNDRGAEEVFELGTRAAPAGLCHPGARRRRFAHSHLSRSAKLFDTMMNALFQHE
jgi:hypothetical protein